MFSNIVDKKKLNYLREKQTVYQFQCILVTTTSLLSTDMQNQGNVDKPGNLEFSVKRNCIHTFLPENNEVGNHTVIT